MIIYNNIMNQINESHLLYRAKNYEISKNCFSDTFNDYDDKFMYELYYNRETNKVLVCIQTEYFSLPSIEPRNIEEQCEHKYVEFFGSDEEFYNLAINKYDIKFHCRKLDEFDIDYNQVNTIYEKFLQHYKPKI